MSHLSLFSTVLTASQIRDLYRTVLLDTLNTFRSQAANSLAPAAAPVAAVPQVFAAPGVHLDPAPSGDGQDLASAPISALDLLMPSVRARQTLVCLRWSQISGRHVHTGGVL